MFCLPADILFDVMATLSDTTDSQPTLETRRRPSSKAHLVGADKPRCGVYGPGSEGQIVVARGQEQADET